MKPPVSPFTCDDLVVTPCWSGTSSCIFTVVRYSQSLAPTRNIGEIIISFSDTEDIPVRIAGSIPEDWNDGQRVMSICKALLANTDIPDDTPYDANFYFGSPKIGIVADRNKDGDTIRI